MADPKPLSRAQLAKFLPDQESIRRFEKMFEIAAELTPDSVNELFSMIASADSKAVTALGIALQALHESTLASDAKSNMALGMIESLRNEASSPPFVQDRTFEKSNRVLAWLMT